MKLSPSPPFTWWVSFFSHWEWDDGRARTLPVFTLPAERYRRSAQAQKSQAQKSQAQKPAPAVATA
jgi:hypothetical protein